MTPQKKGELVLRVDARTTVRPVQLEDADELFALTDANRPHLRAWLPWVDSVTRPEHTREFIRICIDRADRTDAFSAVIETDGQLCGVIGYNWIDSANRACEIGYWLDAGHTGRGIMTGACAALIEHAFETLHLNRVNIPAAVENRRSRAIPERLGFHQDGTIRDAEWLYDHFVDHAFYTLLRSEWSPESV